MDFVVTDIQTVRAKKKNKPFAKHIVRITHSKYVNRLEGERPEIVLENNSAGIGSFKVRLGIFRFICSNGMILGDAFFCKSVVHRGKNFYERVFDAVAEASEHFERVERTIERLKSVELTKDQIMVLRRRIMTQLEVALEKGKEDVEVRLNPNDMARPKRYEDMKNDAWTVINKFQEKVLRGGVRYVKETFEGEKIKERKFNTTRAVKAIDKQIKLNQMVMNLGMEFLQAA